MPLQNVDGDDSPRTPDSYLSETFLYVFNIANRIFVFLNSVVLYPAFYICYTLFHFLIPTVSMDGRDTAFILIWNEDTITTIANDIRHYLSKKKICHS